MGTEKASALLFQSGSWQEADGVLGGAYLKSIVRGLLTEAARVRIMEEGLPHGTQKPKHTLTSKVDLDVQAVAKVLGKPGKKNILTNLPGFTKPALLGLRLCYTSDCRRDGDTARDLARWEEWGINYPDLWWCFPSADPAGSQRARRLGDTAHGGQPPGHRAGDDKFQWVWGHRWWQAIRESVTLSNPHQELNGP